MSEILTFTFTGNFRILVVGGRISSSSYPNVVEIIDLLDNKNTVCQNLADLPVTFISSQKILNVAHHTEGGGVFVFGYCKLQINNFSIVVDILIYKTSFIPLS